MQVSVLCHSLPKAGNSVSENEDAWYPHDQGELSAHRIRVAVSDGATMGMLSDKWANILAKVFYRQWHAIGDVQVWLERLYTDWGKSKQAYLEERIQHNKPIRWYEEPGLAAGAFATLIGLTLESGESETHGTWEAVAIGDSCLFQVRDAGLEERFPIQSSVDFNSTPALLSSNPAWNKNTSDDLKILQGEWNIGDKFYLMTDAFAAWFLHENEIGSTPWDLLDELITNDQPEAFAKWIDEQRAAKEMRNDDVTLVRLLLI